MNNLSLLQVIQLLLRLKRASPETGLAKPLLNAFIADELQRLEQITPHRTEKAKVISRLNQLLHARLREMVVQLEFIISAIFCLLFYSTQLYATQF